MINLTKKGFIFEHEVAEKLKGRGFIHVKVTKASRDYGADILAFKDGLEYVVQCKKYKGTVGFSAVKDIATAMDIYQADRGILVCDTNFSRSARSAIAKIDKPIELIGLEEIKTWKVENIKPIKYGPHRYQKNILNKLIRHRKQGNGSALLVMATGLGKTLVAAWDLKNQIEEGEKALFLVHRKDILVDNADKFYAIFNKGKEQFSFGIYFSGKKFEEEDIVFSTFQTIIKHYKDIPKKYFDYIIIDEAHHSPAPTFSNILEYFKPKFLLGITATPKRITKKDNEFIGEIFGKSLVNLDLAESLINGYLSPVKYSVFCDNIDYGKLKTVKRKLSLEQLNRAYFIPTKDEDIEKIIYQEANKLHNPRIIIFCPSIKYINSVKSVGLFNDAEVYHSNMSDFDREIIFRRFKLGRTKIILVVDLFNEGIDIPGANLVVFLRTTYSPTIFFQQLGRGLRKTPEKKYLRVLDFVGALSKIKKVINVFGHLLIIRDFVQKVEETKRFFWVNRGRIYKDSGLLEPLELDFYQAAIKIKHRETVFKRRNFLSEIKLIKKHLIKSEGWTEEEIMAELRPICEKLGHFPSTGYLKRIGRFDLVGQITEKGDVYYFAKRLGYEVNQKPRDYWKNWENLRNELLPICKNIGRLPSSNYLRGIGRSDLDVAINRIWGGGAKVAAKLGYHTQKKPFGYWDDWQIIKKELSPLYVRIGKMPSQSYLNSIGKGDLAAAISQRWEGFHKVAAKLGYASKQKPKGYWNKWSNLKGELLPICKKLGKMPVGDYLKQIGRNDLRHAIIIYGGGPAKVAKKLGYDAATKPKGYWNKWKNLRNEILPICRKIGKMPSGEYLRKAGRADLDAALYKNWGGSVKVAKRLGYTLSQKPREYWKNWGNLKNELLPICRKVGRMPTSDYFRKIGRTDLNTAINENWGGKLKVAERLGYAVSQKPAGYWKAWENIERELSPICKKLGKMPTKAYLKRIGKSYLDAAIVQNWGGIREVSKRLGIQS